MGFESVTNAETEVLKALWQAGEPQSLAELRRALAETRGWKATTVKTLLYKLRDKGAVEEVGRGVYRAVASETNVAMEASREFIRKQFGGSAKKLVASLIDGGELAAADISELRAMLSVEQERGSGDD
uniref:Transcriptional regulator blaI family n=1 Tax=uncultured bacterium contig00045 TaxID=1181531 RepID=A0A806K099_9BACT|nr:transcriptional regulator blaI family [uncultured bacterium contig00045]